MHTHTPAEIDDLLASYKVISSREVRHRADATGILVGKVEVVEMGGRRFRHDYWYNYPVVGKTTLHHVGSVELTKEG